MNCTNYTEPIILYRELSVTEKQLVDAHIKTCARCEALFKEVKLSEDLILKASLHSIEPAHAAQATGRVMGEIMHSKIKVETKWSFWGMLQSAFARYTLSAASVGLLFFLIIEVNYPYAKQEISKPNPANATLVKGSALRENFNKRNTGTSLFMPSCIAANTGKADLHCLKSKIKSFNL
jgi:hypothetical protein